MSHGKLYESFLPICILCQDDMFERGILFCPLFLQTKNHFILMVSTIIIIIIILLCFEFKLFLL